MRWTEWLPETGRLRLEEAYARRPDQRLTREGAARLWGVCERTVRRYIDRYGRLAIWHGPRRLAVYEATGQLAMQAAEPVREDAA